MTHLVQLIFKHSKNESILIQSDQFVKFVFTKETTYLN
jgi:hypothetical protein